MTPTLTHPCPSGSPRDAFGRRAEIQGVAPAGFHTGQDWAADAGAPILAAHDGRVSSVWWDTFAANNAPAGGNMLELAGSGYATRYAHAIGYVVNPGDRVRAGQVIGHVGRTGAATGNHLHFELLIGGEFVDPIKYLKTKPTPTKKDDEADPMRAIYYKSGKTYRVMILNPVSGFATEFGTTTKSYAENTAKDFGAPKLISVTELHYKKIGGDLANVRRGK